MKRKNAKLPALLLLFPILLLTPGCQNARELSHLLIVSAVGIDASAQGGKKLRVTAQIVLPAQMKSGMQSSESGGSDGGGGSSKPYFNMENDGDSVLTALREMTQTIDNKLYLTHNDAIVFGREAAQDGIRAHLDFFSKEVEIRRSTLVYVADDSAGDILDAGGVFDMLPAVSLKHLAENQTFTSFAMPVTLLDVSNGLLSKTASIVLPIVKVEEIGGQKLHKITGMAVFKADKMIGEMSEQESRGLLFALDRAGYGLTPVTYKDQDVTLEISSTSSCLRPKTDGQEIVFELSVKMKSTIMEQSGTEPLRVEDLDALEALQRAAIQKEIDLALEAAKRLGADVFDFGGLLNKYCPDEWKSMEDNWEALFQRAEFRVAIDNQIYDIGTVSKPLAPEEMK